MALAQAPDKRAMAERSSSLETVLRHDRLAVLAGVALIAALAWGYTAYLAHTMGVMDMSETLMPMSAAWSAPEFVFTVAMWLIMMVAMMLPTAAPYLLIFARVNRGRRAKGGPYVPTALFACGYLVSWGAFSFAAAGAQWALQSSLLIDMNYASATPYLAGGLLVAAGLYQWTPLKHACLKSCRSPFDFIAHRWREGRLGALRMGLEHGTFCVGCCAALMVLLFVFGVMNLVWIAGLAAFALTEKLIARGPAFSRVSGAVLVLGGVSWMLAG